MNRYDEFNLHQDEVFHFPYVVNETDPILPLTQTTDWWGEVVKLKELHNMGFTGKGMVCAVIDTGTDHEHPDLIGAISKVINVTEEDYGITHGHGTGVSGIIGARNNERGTLSVAPDCQIIAIKAMRETGGGSLSEIVSGINAAINEKVDVINLSLGTTGNVASFKDAVERATKAGIYVICSAGNSGTDDSVVYPAKYPVAYAIGATNRNNQVSSFSSRGWEVDVSAPGERVLTTWQNKGYARVSGTSFSAPIVSGLFLLFKQMGIAMGHSIIERTSIDIEEPGEDVKSGHGLIDPLRIAAMRNKPTPTPTVTPTTTMASTPLPTPTTTPSATLAIHPEPTPLPGGCIDLFRVKEAYNTLGEFLNSNNK